jgi:hypothetical protein
LSACASAYVAKPFERADAAPKAIGLAGDAVPEKAIAYEKASIGSNFGLVGALVDAGIQKSRQDAVNTALEGSGFKPETAIEARLASKLSDEGYKVTPLATPNRTKREFLVSYPSDKGVDAYLDLVVLDYGYLASGAGEPFRPTVSANVRLVSAKDPGKVLMENRIVYNGLLPQKGVITLTPNPTYAFNNRAAMLSDPKRLAAGLEDALNQVADTAAKLVG